jgi:hypothetical protein
MWGLNYRRLPVTSGLDFDSARVTPASVDALGTRTVAELNRLHARAHAALPAEPTLAAVRVRLAPAFAEAQRAIGSAHLATPGRPKWSVVSPFFRLAGVDGMVNPLGLEVLVNPELLPIERPFVVAHEWGHLADGAGTTEVLAEEHRARRIGIDAVPCFIIDGDYALAGAQDAEMFLPLFDLALVPRLAVEA